MNTWRLLAGSAILAVVAIATSVWAFQNYSIPSADFGVGILVTFILAVWGALFGLYLRDHRNANVISGMGPPPAAQTEPFTPPPSTALLAGSAGATVNAISIPPEDQVRDELRVERFLRDASFPNEWSRRNAQTWLTVFRLQHPYLAADFPLERERGISRIRAEVAAEPIRVLRNEVREYFTRNDMAWVEIPGPRSPGPPTGLRSPTPAQTGTKSRLSPRISVAPTHADSVREEAGGARARAKNGTKAAGMLAENLLFDDQLSIPATGHAEIHFDLPEGTRLRGLARELLGQPFDLYIMDRRNYVRFAREHKSRDLLAELGQSFYDYKARIPRDDTWFLVVDTYGKVNDREVWLEVRATAPA